MIMQFTQPSIDRSLDFLLNVSTSEAGLFYTVNKELQAESFTLHAIDAQIQEHYRMHFYGLDPLQARHYRFSELNLISFDRVPAHLHRQRNVFLNEFLIPFGYHQILEVFFRIHDRIVAGISLLRRQPDRPFTMGELNLIERARDFVEFRLLHENPVVALNQVIERLTSREAEVLDLLCAGNSNKKIAFRLAIEPCTVKTHLRNIYGKIGVENRKDLLAQLLRKAPHYSG